MISADDWSVLEAGLLQRVRALDAFCADVYGSRQIVADGVVPARVIDTIDTLEPALCGVDLDRWIGIAGLDPGARAGRPLPRARGQRANAERDGLRRRRPRHDLDAAAAGAARRCRSTGCATCCGWRSGTGGRPLLTDGPANTAHWEHQWLADLLEIPLHEPDGFDPTAFDVVYRRTDASALDSAVGRLLHGRVRVVNAYGTGVADDKLAHAYVEDMVRYYLREEPRLGSIRTYDLGRPEVAAEVLDRIDELVVKPRAGYGGEGVVICPHAAREDVVRVRDAVRAAPEDYIAQEMVPLSEHPTVVDGEWRCATWTCGRSCSSGRTAPGACTRAGSRAWLWMRARWS